MRLFMPIVVETEECLAIAVGSMWSECSKHSAYDVAIHSVQSGVLVLFTGLVLWGILLGFTAINERALADSLLLDTVRSTVAKIVLLIFILREGLMVACVVF